MDKEGRMSWRDRGDKVQTGLLVGVLVAIIFLILSIGLFGLICSKYIIFH